MRSSQMTEASHHGETKVFSTRTSVRSETDFGHRRAVSVSLWIVQGLLACVFLFTGGMKLTLPLEVLTAPMPLPGFLVRFVGLCELLGAIGLVLPRLTRIPVWLTPVAGAR